MLCTVFDLRQQNENTWKDITPFPDQDAIHDIARANFRSKHKARGCLQDDILYNIEPLTGITFESCT